MHNPIYYIIDNQTGEVAVRRNASDVSTYMLGRQTSKYTITKSYDKVLDNPSWDVFELEKQLKEL